MKPTTEQVLQWAEELDIEIFSSGNAVQGMSTYCLKQFAALAYAAGAKAMNGRCAEVCDRHAASSNAAKVIAAAISALGDDDECQRSKDKNLQKLVDQLVHPKDAGTTSMGGEGLKND